MTDEASLQKLDGVVDHVVYTNAETGFGVIELAVGSELLTAVGDFHGVEVGEELSLTGKYVSHPTYGQQFKAEMFERRLPATASAILRYLSSGAVKGIGPVLARRLVDRFGDDTLHILEENPERLTEVKGISPQKATVLAESFRRVFGVRTVMLSLSQLGLSAAQGVQAWKKWGLLAADAVRENPYLLCDEEIGVTFPQADRIAQGLSLPMNSRNRLRAAVLYVITANLNNGHTCLPRDKVTHMVLQVTGLDYDQAEMMLDLMLESGELLCYRRGKEFLFLPELLLAEQYIAERLAAMLGQSFHAEDMDKLIARLEREQGIHYAALQKKAIREAYENQVFILTGGPGTGKTTTLRAIIALLEQQGQRVAIAAPTGRAAKRLSEVTGKDAGTVHRLLEVDRQSGGRLLQFQHHERNPLKVDAVIIDEMSMMDTMLFDALLRALRSGARLILVGDSDQLPSVGAGNVLKDMLDSDCIPSVALTEIFRQAAKSLIVTNAHHIVAGENPVLDVTDRDFFFLTRHTPETVNQTVVELAAKRLPQRYGISPFEDIQVLSPSRKGATGIDILNPMLQQRLNPPAEDKPQVKYGHIVFRVGDKVMQVRNNYDIVWKKENEKGVGVYNGDIGRILSIDRAANTVTVSFDGRTAEYATEQLSELELAYAATVHKSQGNEFPAVILPILGGYDRLYFRNLLYTAVTRARQMLILVGEKERVEFMVKNNLRNLRYTGLKYLLQQEVLGKSE